MQYQEKDNAPENKTGKLSAKQKLILAKLLFEDMRKNKQEQITEVEIKKI